MVYQSFSLFKHHLFSFSSDCLTYQSSIYLLFEPWIFSHLPSFFQVSPVWATPIWIMTKEIFFMQTLSSASSDINPGLVTYIMSKNPGNISKKLLSVHPKILESTKKRKTKEILNHFVLTQIMQINNPLETFLHTKEKNNWQKLLQGKPIKCLYWKVKN